jgi:hypothetical protein
MAYSGGTRRQHPRRGPSARRQDQVGGYGLVMLIAIVIAVVSVHVRSGEMAVWPNGWVVFVGCAWAIYWASQPRDIDSRLRKLEPVEDKSERDFVRALGLKPVSISTHADGSRLLRWRHGAGTSSTQSVSVLFDANHRFLRVTNRSHAGDSRSA